nr:inositol 1,4,5-trisphosphate receptor-interacting protein-like 1 [Anser cygnoides]
MFGVQQGDSDIFLSSENTEAIFTPDTIWPQSCAVAEMKFFRHIAANAQQDSFHLRCMQLCARILVGNDFTTYMLKTVVMHLLTIIPLESWRRRDFLQRMDDIMQYLALLYGREMPQPLLWQRDVIVLPPAFQFSGPVNLFQHLKRNPYAKAEALQKFEVVRDRLKRLLIYGHERDRRAQRERSADGR